MSSREVPGVVRRLLTGKCEKNETCGMTEAGSNHVPAETLKLHAL